MLDDAYNSTYRSIWMYLYDVAFTQGYVDAGGVRTRYIQAGPKDAPTVILLHGTAASWEVCCANIRSLAEDFNTIAIDMIGSGLTDKPDRPYQIPVYVEHVKDVMDALHVSRASFVGVSLGSFVALKFAQLYPERTEKVTSVAAFGRPMAGGQKTGSEKQRQDIDEGKAKRQSQVENPTWAAMEALFVPLIKKKEDRIPDLLAIRQAIYRRPGAGRTMENIFAAYEPDIFNQSAFTNEDLSKIETPVLVIIAVDCEDSSLENAREFARLLPNARGVEMPGAGHWAQWECADEFNRINRAFLLERL
jgi:2-hydroxy-6-oxonona-2,4-dienedioate hydrolase